MVRKLVAGAALCWGCAAAVAAGELVEVSVHERAGGPALAVHHHEGRRYVVGRPGGEYRIRLRNRGGSDILAVVSVDGVNVVTGETAGFAQGGYVLSPGQSFDIAGWRKSLDRVAAFYFTERANSYAARTGRPDNVGVIGVAVFRRKAEPAAIPPSPRPFGESRDRPAPEAGGAAPDSAPGAPGSDASRARAAPWPRLEQSLGTGHGRSTDSRVTYTRFERATVHPEEVVAIHYDSYENLLARGVIRAPRIAAPVPFPGPFVPDPH
ncbi:MAG: hypothetical protein IT529_11105 [Burkholderiales bacterium]|nr:hypothetical protein [Burkholderiales bacterium]